MSEDLLGRVASIVTILGVLTPVILAALAFWLSKFMATKKQLRAWKGELVRDFNKDLNGFGERVDRTEKLYIGANDQLANLRTKQDSVGNRLDNLERYGGPAVDDLRRTIRNMERTLLRIADKLNVPHE